MNRTRIRQNKNTSTEGKNCIVCSRLQVCPVIRFWVEVTGCPMEALSFSCSEYKRQEMPKEVEK